VLEKHFSKVVIPQASQSASKDYAKLLRFLQQLAKNILILQLSTLPM
jgi:fatty acid-binding protein DegV